MLGNSGAEIHFLGDTLVEKVGGGTDLVEQARLCVVLEDVCPRVYAIDEKRRSYVMERLVPLGEHERPDDVLREIAVMLRTRVWPRIETLPAYDAGWIEQLRDYLDRGGQHELRRLLDHLYSGDKTECQVVTHGDPTLVNAMRGSDYRLVLIDPLPPRPYVPRLAEVDTGKLLQSCGGWEGVVADGVPLVMANLAPELVISLRGAQPCSDWAARCYFWAAVHCARIIPYARTIAVRSWCHEWIQHWSKECKRELGI